MPSCVTAAGRAACACRSQLASLLACQMPLKFGLPATVAGRVIGAWPDVRVTDAEMTAPTEAAAIATVSIESAKRSRMRASLGLLAPLLRRLAVTLQSITGAGRLQRPRNRLHCPWWQGVGRALPHRRLPPCVLPE